MTSLSANKPSWVRKLHYRLRFWATVKQETQAKVDSNHPDGIVQNFSHLPLAQEEKIRAREAQLEHISAPEGLGTQDGRAKQTHEVVIERRQRMRAERTADRMASRERLSWMELATRISIPH